MFTESKKKSERSSLWASEMSSVTEERDMLLIRSAWECVFSTNDPFTWPFRHEVEVCRIFYPTDGYHLTEEQYSAATSAVQGVGEVGFLISIVESKGLAFLDRSWGHWSCDLPSYEEYCELPLTLENALYSRNGCWGILISHEMHALIGGSKAFMGVLGDRYQRWRKDLHLLRDAWLGNPNSEWLEPIIARAGP